MHEEDLLCPRHSNPIGTFDVWSDGFGCLSVCQRMLEIVRLGGVSVNFFYS